MLPGESWGGRNALLRFDFSTVFKRETTANLPRRWCRGRWPHSRGCTPIKRTSLPAVAVAPDTGVNAEPAASGFVVEVGKDLVDHYRIFDTGDDVHGRTNVALGRMPRVAGGRGVFGRVRRAGLVVLAALGRRHLCTMRAVAGKHAVMGIVHRSLRVTAGCHSSQ